MILEDRAKVIILNATQRNGAEIQGQSGDISSLTTVGRTQGNLTLMNPLTPRDRLGAS